jgi:hypothetical protein
MGAWWGGMKAGELLLAPQKIVPEMRQTTSGIESGTGDEDRIDGARESSHLLEPVAAPAKITKITNIGARMFAGSQS